MTETILVLLRSEAVPPLVLRISVTACYRTATSRALDGSNTSFDLATVGNVLFFTLCGTAIVGIEQTGHQSNNDSKCDNHDFLLLTIQNVLSFYEKKSIENALDTLLQLWPRSVSDCNEEVTFMAYRHALTKSRQIWPMTGAERSSQAGENIKQLVTVTVGFGLTNPGNLQ